VESLVHHRRVRAGRHLLQVEIVAVKESGGVYKVISVDWEELRDDGTASSNGEALERGSGIAVFGREAR
jgi:hypothetical protein